MIVFNFVGFFLSESSSSSGTCDPNPCQNGGTCEDIGNGDYTCQCPGVYGGDNCEKSKTLKVFVFGCLLAFNFVDFFNRIKLVVWHM